MSASPSVVPLEYTAPTLAEKLGADWRTVLAVGHRWMQLARALDRRMLALQKQGRVGFYGPATGQEAVNVGAALVSRAEDWVVPGLREQLIALVRGHPLGTYVHHLFADAADPALGRQMPCHPTARDVQYVSMSSVVGTQIIHAVGLAYAARLRHDSKVVFAFFGDGATSANDFHSGLNFAAVLRVPVVFCCTNNQWAISLPVERQTRVPRLADKAVAYGMPGERVDGTDLVAVYAALRTARASVVAGGGPRLLEFVVYRMTPHSSSDDPSRYQAPGWQSEAAAHDPLLRLESLLRAVGLWSPEMETPLTDELEAHVRASVSAAESVGPPGPETLRTDVFADLGVPSRATEPAG